MNKTSPQYAESAPLQYVTDQKLFFNLEKEQLNFVEPTVVYGQQKKKVSLYLLITKIFHIVSFHQMKSIGFIIYESLYLPVRYTSQMKHKNIK